MRRLVLEEGYRADGRSIGDVRPIWSRAGLLPRTHGSVLFTRGETQVRCARCGGEVHAVVVRCTLWWWGARCGGVVVHAVHTRRDEGALGALWWWGARCGVHVVVHAVHARRDAGALRALWLGVHAAQHCWQTAGLRLDISRNGCPFPPPSPHTPPHNPHRAAQALAVTTLGCNRSAQRIDTMAEEDEEQRFYLQVCGLLGIGRLL